VVQRSLALLDEDKRLVFTLKVLHQCSYEEIAMITGFSLAVSGQTTYTFSTISTIAAGISTLSLAEDKTGTYVLAVNAGGNPDLSTYKFDTTTTGKLDAGPTSATGTDPTQAIWIVAHP